MNTNFAAPETTIDGGEGTEVAPDIQALTQLNAAEINQQIMTARAYPRSVTGFRRNMRELVAYNEQVALSCLYALKRSNKVIEGPSIRFAEASIQSWGNCRVGARIVDVGDTHITAQGFFYDLEKNVAVAFEVMRRITDKEGRRYNDDMITVTGNAACSIALRNAVLKGIPRTAWDEPYQEARRISVGQGESITIKRDNMLKAFAPMGVVKEQVFGLLGVKGIDDVTIEHMILMNGILNSIKEGDQTVEQAFSVENMVNPDVVAPGKPLRSDFNREVAKAEPEKVEVERVTAAETKVEERAAGKATDAKLGVEISDRERERQDLVHDAFQDVANATTVRMVNDLESGVEAADLLEPDELAKFRTYCTERRAFVMRSNKPKGKK